MVFLFPRKIMTQEKTTFAEPASLGLTGLAVTVLVIGASYLGLISSVEKSLMIPWILFFGATAQLLAGVTDFKKNNIFGATVFTTYAMTMYSIALTLFITTFTEVSFDISHYGYGLIGVLVFTLFATVASLMTNKVLYAILIAVDVSLILLIPHYLIGFTSQPAGLSLIITSILSFYAAAAILLNTMAGKTILPMGSPIIKK